MPLFGIDISDYQAEISLKSVKAQGYNFVIAQSSFGDRATNRYPNFRDQAEAANILFGAYHFITPGISGVTQAQTAFRVSEGMPMSVDFEQGEYSQLVEFVNEYRSLGGKLSTLYVPHFYWQRVGEPDLRSLGMPMWGAFSYGKNVEAFGSVAYADNGVDYFTAYGDEVPVIAQFGGRIILSDYAGQVDGDAFNGSLDELIRTDLLHSWNVLPPNPPAPPDPHKGLVQYTVESGDTLSSIAEKYGESLSEVEHDNPQIGNPNVLSIGEKVWVKPRSVPEVEYYIVRAGDTLTRIAQRFNTTVSQLVEWNHIQNANVIYPNERIRVR